MPVHYTPTASRTMCGRMVTRRTEHHGDLHDFASAIADPGVNYCRDCTSYMRRYPRLHAVVRIAFTTRADAMLAPDPGRVWPELPN